MNRGRTVLVLAGPTAVGKTSVAVELCMRLGAEIISADSRQVYRHLDIGTAKPTPEERSLARHRLIDIIDPGQPYSAAAFSRDARREMDSLDLEGRPYIVAGGSGLYIKALVEGLSPMPPVDPEISRRLRHLADRQGISALYRRLSLEDPPTAARLKPADRSRIIRALEVLEATGSPISRWHEGARQGDGRNYIIIVLNRDRDDLYRRIDRRVDEMIGRGLVSEVEGIMARGMRRGLEESKAVGYREVLGFLDGAMDKEAMITAIKRNTRRFAKRQTTWFRGVANAEWLDAGGEGGMVGAIAARLGRAGA